MDTQRLIQLLISPNEDDFEIGRTIANNNNLITELFIKQLDSMQDSFYFIARKEHLLWRFKSLQLRWIEEVIDGKIRTVLKETKINSRVE